MPGQLVKIFNTKMGNIKSKQRDSSASRAQKANSRSDMQSNMDSDNKDHPLEDPEIKRLKINIKNNPELFILNNLMMCVDFFQNYDEEMSELRETLVSPNEKALNKRLLPQKRVLLPDILQERIVKNVTFISRRETVDPTMEPLQPVRMFVVYENIEVSDQHDSCQYSSMNETITYNMRLKPSKHKGYVHLERTGITPSKKSPTRKQSADVDLSSIAENGDEYYSDSEAIYSESKTAKNSKLKATSRRSRKLSTEPSSSKTKSTPDLVNESNEVIERLSTGTSKLTENLQDYKDDTDYGFVSDSRSSRDQRSVNRAPRSQKRGFNRDSQFPSAKTRSVSASPASSTSSGYKSGNYDTDSEYGSSSGRGSNKPRILDSAEIPDSCFSLVTYTPDDRIYDPMENKMKRTISSKERQVQVERNRHNYDVWYLNSTKFRKRFYNVFLETLAPLLGLGEVIRFRWPLFFGSVIYCDKVEINPAAKCNMSESYEIIPCVWTQWPECANDWLTRPRHSWPNYEMIQQIRKSGCYIIPQEFRSKDDHLSYKTEWQLAFPAAERYLETCMSHPQMRVYIIALMLHKTFIRAVESAPDRLNAHQIRNQLFWLMEHSLLEWSENKTGDYLLKLLDCLCSCISQNEAFLKDYFLEGKNLFKNSEKGSLYFSLKQLKRILGNPVMYILHALENIRYKTDFFPKLNYEELLRILTTEELFLFNANLQKNSAPTMRLNFMEDEYNVGRGFWDDAKKNPEHFSNFNRRPVTNKTLINPSKAHDSVVDIAIRCGELKGIRLSTLLNFFIEHLIKMGEKYHEYGAVQQKTEYLQHAMNLSILLAEDEMFQENARSQIREIVSLQKLVTRSRSRDEPPETPKRNAEPPNFSKRNNPSSSSIASSVPESQFQETLESGKKMSDSSLYSQSWKDRYSSSDQSSTTLPNASVYGSRSNSPPLKKKSDPPAYFRPLKDRFLVTSPEVTSPPLVEETSLLSDVLSTLSATGESTSDVLDQSGNQDQVHTQPSILKEQEKRDDLEKSCIYNRVFEEKKKIEDLDRISIPGQVFEDKKSSAVPNEVYHQVSRERKENEAISRGGFTHPRRMSVRDKIKIYSNPKEEILEAKKKASTLITEEKNKSDVSIQQNIPDQVHLPVSPEKKKTSVNLPISEEKKENEAINRDPGRISVRERIKIYSNPKEDISEAKKKVSQESRVISLKDDDDSSHDTYI